MRLLRLRINRRLRTFMKIYLIKAVGVDLIMVYLFLLKSVKFYFVLQIFLNSDRRTFYEEYFVAKIIVHYYNFNKKNILDK